MTLQLEGWHLLPSLPHSYLAEQPEAPTSISMIEKPVIAPKGALNNPSNRMHQIYVFGKISANMDLQKPEPWNPKGQLYPGMQQAQHCHQVTGGAVPSALCCAASPTALGATVQKEHKP